MISDYNIFDKSIVVVDDDPKIGELFEIALKRDGFEHVISFTDPLTARDFILDKNGKLIPDVNVSELPDNFLIPCSCLKCAQDNVYPCRARIIACCDYCKCDAHFCRDPITSDSTLENVT